MCGFVCQFSFGSQKVDPHLVERMNESIFHRGPDDGGVFSRDWFALGFRRLSILDTSDFAHQPMVSDDGQKVLVFNGEVYNFRSIRSELEAKGYIFRSSGDTEVILKSILEWGPQAVSKFRGMFAIVFVDIGAKTAFAARDHLGVKPLYLARDRDNLYIASEIKPFKQCLGLSLNEDALYEQFSFRSVAGSRTLFNEVERLKPGTILSFDPTGQTREISYYSVTDTLRAPSNDTPDQEKILSWLTESIDLHTVSDVGYNIQLSGGIDSSFLTSVLSGISNSTLRTYSVEFPGSDLDEGQYQREVAEKFHTEHHSFTFDNNSYAELLAKATWYMDAPIVHSGCPLLMGLCFEAKKTSKVILTGEGADELFLGYSRYRLSKRQRLAFMLRSRQVPSSILPSIPLVRGIKKLMERDLSIDSLSFDSDVLQELVKGSKSYPYRSEVVKNLDGLTAKMIASDQACYLQTLLERQDRMSMAASVEARVPFCNPDLFDRINPLAHSKKINPEPKIILKRMMEQNFANSFIYRRKNGFKLPLRHWLREKKGMGELLDLISDKTFASRGFYDIKLANQTVSEHLSGAIDRSKELFALITFELWHRAFLDA